MASTTPSSEIVGQTSSNPSALDRLFLTLEAIFGLAVIAAIVGGTYGAFPAITFVLCAISVAFTGWVLVLMIGSVSDPTLQFQGRVRDYQREKLEGEKTLLLQGIKDLEIDYATSKMDEKEYKRLRQSAETRAIEIITLLRESDNRWAQEAEKLVMHRLGGAQKAPPVVVELPSTEGSSAGPVVVKDSPLADIRVFDDRPVSFTKSSDQEAVCSACGYTNDADARFCSGCGRPQQKMEAA